MLLPLLLHGCKKGNQSGKGKRLNVFAAASFSEVIDEIAQEFSAISGIEVVVNKASSGTLARQLAHDIPGDIYLSANYRWAQYLDSLGLIYKGRLTEIAHNSLVLIAESGTRSGEQSQYLSSIAPVFKELKKGRIAMGDPVHVPAGVYAREALTYFGHYENLKQNIVPTKDVRSALMAVETGEVPYGIIYKSDALKSKKIIVVGGFPEGSYSHIACTVAQVSAKANAFELYRFLLSASAQHIFIKHGFGSI